MSKTAARGGWAVALLSQIQILHMTHGLVAWLAVALAVRAVIMLLISFRAEQ